ncbi:MAG: NAD(P)/FAD-dependent oxidoreductase [Candidatus Solibacter usitatus]|nr:NAD(P)/FAD-dependent oxidoreductase [Candidatus Solibacter usitatus]
MSAPAIVVVGAGPAGVAAACRAAGCGRRVVLLDDNPAPGGQIWRGDRQQRWLARLADSGVEVRCGTTVSGLELPGATTILATGARELFLPFPGWTSPGVTGAGGLQALIKSGFSIAGKRVVVAGSGLLLPAVASLVRKSGGSVVLIAEQTSAMNMAAFAAALLSRPEKLAQSAEAALSLLGVPYFTRCVVESFDGGRVRLRRGNAIFECDTDYLASGFGLVPNTELAALLGCRLLAGAVEVDEFQQTTVAGVYAAGELTGIGGVEKSLVEGEIAGLAAAGAVDEARALFGRSRRARRFSAALNRAFALDGGLRALPRDETLVCRCEDVSHSRLKGLASWRQAKLHTRCGMGPCQGRVCAAAAQFLYGWNDQSPRPPVFPVPAGLLADPGSFEGEPT